MTRRPSPAYTGPLFGDSTPSNPFGGRPTPPQPPAPIIVTVAPPAPRPAPQPPRRRSRITFADTITPLPVSWLYQDRIPAGSLSMAAGREGTGKSSFGIWLTARMTTGTLPGIHHGTPRAVIYAATEDSWAHTLVPRLIAAGADLSMVGRLDVYLDNDVEVPLSLPDDLTELQRAITDNHVGLVVLDPLMSLMGATIDTHRNREVRTALDPLVKVADTTGAAILGIAHFNKSSGTDAASLISGSGAFKDVPRAVFGFARDTDGRVMTQVKNSLGRDDLPSMTYELTSVDVPIPGHLPTNVARFDFTGVSDRAVEDMLRDSHGGDDDQAERDHVASWLTDYLEHAGGTADAAAIKKAAHANGIAERTLKRARSRIGATFERRGYPATSVWSLPPERGPVDSRATS